MYSSFNNVIALYRQLATRALLTLHLDIRYGINYMLGQGLAGPHIIDQPVHEPDPMILALNASLLAFDETMTTHLPELEYKFMTSGLGLLLDSIIANHASKIKLMNINGCGKMQLNILVLQQNLKSVESEIVLRKSAAFFEYFQQGSKAIVKIAQKSKGQGMDLSEDEIKALVELCYSEQLSSPQRDVAAQAKRAMQQDMLLVTESMWST